MESRTGCDLLIERHEVQLPIHHKYNNFKGLLDDFYSAQIFYWLSYLYDYVQVSDECRGLYRPIRFEIIAILIINILIITIIVIAIITIVITIIMNTSCLQLFAEPSNALFDFGPQG